MGFEPAVRAVNRTAAMLRNATATDDVTEDL